MASRFKLEERGVTVLVELFGVIADTALSQALSVASSVMSAVSALFAGGMPDTLGAGGLTAGGATATTAAGTTSGGPAGSPRDQWPRFLRDGPLRTNYRDSNGNAYWPGCSAIPGDGVAYTDRLTMYNNEPATRGPHPVDPDTGRVITPKLDMSSYQGRAGVASAARG